jgi:hypothetical protein
MKGKIVREGELVQANFISCPFSLGSISLSFRRNDYEESGYFRSWRCHCGIAHLIGAAVFIQALRAYGGRQMDAMPLDGTG